MIDDSNFKGNGKNKRENQDSNNIILKEEDNIYLNDDLNKNENQISKDNEINTDNKVILNRSNENNIIQTEEELNNINILSKKSNANENNKDLIDDLLNEQEPEIEHLNINEKNEIIITKESNIKKQNNNKSNKNINENIKNNNIKNKEKIAMSNKKNNNNNIINTNQTNINKSEENKNQNKNSFKELSPQEISEISLNLDKLFINNLKDSKIQIINNNISDREQLKLDLIKESSKLKANINDNFMIRMVFDVLKRQNKEKRLEYIIEKTKNKIDENKRIKSFNRLIEDANRRLEVQEQLINLKNKLEENEIEKPLKKYKQEQWENIYNKRFKNYQNLHDTKIQLEINKKEEEKKKDEEKEIQMCKVIKKPMKNIIEYCNKLYKESKKKNEIKTNKIMYDKLVGSNKNVKVISLNKTNNRFKSPIKKSLSPNKFFNKKNLKQKNFLSFEKLINEFRDNDKIKLRSEKKLNERKDNNFNNNYNIKENKTSRGKTRILNHKNNDSYKIVDEFYLNGLL